MNYTRPFTPDGDPPLDERSLPATPTSNTEPVVTLSRSGTWMMVLCLFMIGAVLFAVFDSPTTSASSLWPILLVLLCPLLHFVMHRGHSSSHAH